ncbi:MAG: THUMP domain-containing protein [Bacteroidales bacterium]|jgi:putative N6-adenine-specific DNA methylase|nr:THUMP domain-containing protein [Bacteroidales bacterium]
MNNEIFIAKTFAGIEPFLKEELENLGALECETVSRGVKFKGDLAMMYKINYFSRLSSRVLWQVKTFHFHNNNDFYDAIFQIPVERYLAGNGTLAVSATLHESIFKTPLFAALLTKDAICDRFRDRQGQRPSVDKDNPDVQFHVHVHRDEAFLYLDSSGESLHKRGYRVAIPPAPINEVLAAAMLYISRWQGEHDLIDFTCGSGTILIEGAMKALDIPAGYYRHKFGFFSWLNFDKIQWKKIIRSANIKQDVPVDFYGYDISGRAIGMAEANVKSARLQDFIQLRKKPLQQTTPYRVPAYIISNPPYGERLENEDIRDFYRTIGDILKQQYAGCTAFIISSNIPALKAIGLHPSLKHTLYNGALECKLMKFDLYEGSMFG